jgi:mono/diheme cytochrome c family protein
MSVLAFVLFWTLVAIGLLYIALSGGPRGARERLHKQSARGRRIAYGLFALTLVLFGIAVPALVVAGVESRDSDPSSNIAKLTSEEEEGRAIFGKQCNQCHTLAAAGGVATVGPNLDVLRPTKGLVLDAIENGRARGNGAMAADLVEGREAEAVAAFVAKAVGKTEENQPDPTAQGEQSTGGEGEATATPGPGGQGEEDGAENDADAEENE